MRRCLRATRMSNGVRPGEGRRSDGPDHARLGVAPRARADAVAYEATGTRTCLKGCFDHMCRPSKGSHIPPADYPFATTHKWLLNFKKNWARKDYSGQMFFECKEWIPINRTTCFDGEEIRVFEPRDKNPNPLNPEAPDLTIHKSGFPVLSYVDGPVFFSHGIVKTLRQSPTLESLAPPLEADQFSHHGFGVLDGQKHAIGRTAARKSLFHEYWVDLSRESAVSRAITYSSGQVFAQVDVQYQKIPWGWVPQA